MNHTEREYIDHCKRRIEEKFHFQNEEGTLRQRDLEYLADGIEESSGIKLSLSTLKRLWKKDYDQTPHPSTLQALVSLLGYKDWQDFKFKEVANSDFAIPKPTKKKKSFPLWIITLGVATISFAFWLIGFSPRASVKNPIVHGAVKFTGNKTVARGVPNSVIFNYDLSKVVADSFFFQQSWNPLSKVAIDPNGHYYTNIYYYPGFH